MPLTFTMSQDGRQRATVRLDFRVGLDQLATAAALALDDDYVDGDDADTMVSRASKIGKGRIEQTLREVLPRGGADALVFANEHAYMGSEVFTKVEDACRERVRKLWPELQAVTA